MPARRGERHPPPAERRLYARDRADCSAAADTSPNQRSYYGTHGCADHQSDRVVSANYDFNERPDTDTAGQANQYSQPRRDYPADHGSHCSTAAPKTAPTAAPEATSAAQAPSGHSTTSVPYVAHSSPVALCHGEDSQRGMDTANGVQSIQVRNVQPDAVQEYLRTSGLDHLMVPGGDCGPTS